MKKLATLFGALAVALSLTACNTVKGIGQDVQAGGRAVEGVATDAQK